jgi:Protein of unknown function (DUF2442)
MYAQSTAEEDPTPDLAPPIRSRMPWRVLEAEALPGFRLRVRFVDGLQGTVDLSHLVRSSTAGVFAKLADPELFSRVYVEYGAVTWPGEIDLAPDAMHAAIRRSGEWVLP